MDKIKNPRRRGSSGGVIANNYRQGSRAESLAQYFFSELCIAERALKENDFGIDLYCSLMDVNGIMGSTSTLFGVQIKSGNAPFNYRGDAVSNWLKMVNIPLIMCRADRKTLMVELFSTWTLNSLLSSNEVFNEIEFVESYSSDAESRILKMPEINEGIATLWMGPPFIRCTLNDLINEPDIKIELVEILKEWVSLDFSNYSKRHVGITVYFGYLNWEINKSLNSSLRQTYKPHTYSYEHSLNAIKLILEASSMIALNQGQDHPFVNRLADLLRSNPFLDISAMDSWQLLQLGIPLDEE